jgi:hypothetical protein
MRCFEGKNIYQTYNLSTNVADWKIFRDGWRWFGECQNYRVELSLTNSVESPDGTHEKRVLVGVPYEAKSE